MKGAKQRHLSYLLLLLLLTAACQDSRSSSAESAGQKAGGTLIFGTDQFPDCLDPLTQCADLEWLRMAVLRPTMAQLLTVDRDNDYVASDLIETLPSIKNGQVTKDPFTVTYRLNRSAVWDDGAPITGKDVEFTWRAYRHNASTREQYDRITNVSFTRHAVTLAFREPHAPWKELFPYVLKASAFAGRPEVVSGSMQDNLPFAGGPFKLQSFTKTEIVLVRNEKYYGRKALLAKVIFRKIDSSRLMRAFSEGEIHAFFPPPTPNLAESVTAVPGARMEIQRGAVAEGLWFNLDAFPVNDPAVRQALLHGLDRQAAIDATVKDIDPAATVNRCLFSIPNLARGKWCNDDFPVAPHRQRARQRARRALEEGGWQLDPRDGIYSKGSRRLVIPIATTAGNRLREHMQQILQEQAKDLGIEIRSDNSRPDAFFGRIGTRDFVAAIYGLGVLPDPGVTESLASDRVPPAGRNYYGWRDEGATKLMKQSDTEIGEGKRRRLFQRLGKLMRRDVISIPLYQRPQILVWDGSRLGGDFEFNPMFGFSAQLATWFFL